ncbi:MAG: Gfo/Idh/MocA family oxidoreductase [Verrucomicrobia bacterium]|nr:Gfo/Idh/MocA family oxidoreductase [Verrucomicrobiota bacterium]
MRTRYKVVIAGCGPRGEFHAEGFLKNKDRFELTACCDLDVERLQAFGNRFGVSDRYTDAETMLDRERPDIFCFATLPAIRLPLVELGVKYGVKAIAFEKPMATELTEAREIYDLCQRAGVKFIVSHQQKYGPHWREAKKIVQNGDIGEVTKIHATSRAWLSQLGTHLLDYMLWFNDRKKVRWVTGQAFGTQMLTDSHPSPDFVFGTIQFANGVRGIIECGAHAPRLIPGDNVLRSPNFWFDSSITVHGTHGYTEVVTGTGWRAITKDSAGKLLSGEGAFDPLRDQPLYLNDLADWMDGLTDSHPCDGDITYHGFEAAFGLCISALERRRVFLPLETVPKDSLIARFKAELPSSQEYLDQ